MPYKFYGGVHPPVFKIPTADKAVKKVFIPKRVVIPLLQHTGSAAEPVVKVGDSVKAGALIGKATGFISSPVHASINGRVTKIAYAATPVFARVLSISIESENEEQSLDIVKQKDISSLSKEELLNIIRDAGIVGLGGAAFPTHVKLSPPKEKKIDAVILNGVECEPYLTCDQRLMTENPIEILRGLEIIAKILDVKNVYIAIEDNKPLAIQAMRKAANVMPAKAGIHKKLVPAKAGMDCRFRGNDIAKKPADIKVISLKTKYPQGAEKQVIKVVLNRIVPAGGLPMDVGCVVQNVGTAFAIYEAVELGKPLIERIITIAGPCVKEPVNIKVRIGTLLSDLVNFLGGFAKEPKKIIIGGPMMGVTEYTIDVPITKRVSGVLFFSKDEIERNEEDVCIRCGKCLEVCPMELMPTTLMHHVKKEGFLEAKELGVANCFECGACAYVCPAKIPLLDYMKFGKSKI